MKLEVCYTPAESPLDAVNIYGMPPVELTLSKGERPDLTIVVDRQDTYLFKLNPIEFMGVVTERVRDVPAPE